MKKQTIYWISGILVAVGIAIALYFALRKDTVAKSTPAAPVAPKAAPAKVAAQLAQATTPKTLATQAAAVQAGQSGTFTGASTSLPADMGGGNTSGDI
jgi:hypothetical protein